MQSLDLHAGIKRVVVGYFDPVTSVNVRRLRELASGDRSIAVVLEDPPSPLLTREARAELVAALAVVDQVTTTSPAAFSSIDVVYEQEADTTRRTELIEHIHARQAAART